MKTLKWILAGLAPAMAAGSAILTVNPKPDFVFWWAVGAALVGGLAGKSMNHSLDKMSEPIPDEEPPGGY